jgi:WD40 repeat protein
MLADAYQFARHNHYLVDLAPLQLYASALIFAPDLSIVKQLFKSCSPSWLLNPPKIRGTWRDDLLDFEGHTSVIQAIAFSPDDKLLGTCSIDGTVRIWDTTDANCSLKVAHYEGRFCPHAIAFSSDSSRIAVVYKDQNYDDHQLEYLSTIVVVTYITKTGNRLRTTECEDVFRGVLCLAVAFDYDDDATCAMIAHTDQVQFWHSMEIPHALTRAWAIRFPAQKDHLPISVAISRDASLICCSGVLDENDDEETIGVLDRKTGAFTNRYGRVDGVGGITISGADLVYQTRGRENGSFCLRSLNVETGESDHICGYDGLLHSDIWFSNGKDRVVFAQSVTACMETLFPSHGLRKLTREDPWESLVAVAPKGDLAIVARDTHLEVLDTRGVVVEKIPKHIDKSWGPACYLTISPDCQYVALGLAYGTVVWDIRKGNVLRCSWLWSSFNIFKRCFSSDNKSLVCTDGNILNMRSLESNQTLWSTTLPQDWDIRRLRMSADGEKLLTDQGWFHIATATWTMSPTTMFGKEAGLKGGIGYLFQRDEWIQFDGEDLLWLPNEYRSSNSRTSDAQGPMVALSQKDGGVMVLNFRDPSGIYETVEQ